MHAVDLQFSAVYGIVIALSQRHLKEEVRKKVEPPSTGILSRAFLSLPLLEPRALRTR